MNKQSSHTQSSTARSELQPGKLWWPLAALCVLCTFALPLFVCMPLTPDAVLYDLQARNVLDGGVAYRDMLEPNLPGALWVHMLVRSSLGESTEILRVFDFFVLAMITMMIVHWLPRSGQSVRTCVITAIAICLFYFSMSEWCHCQRDTWMLLPALLAARLRWKQIQRGPASKRLFLFGFVEGLVWGVAFWLKPFIAFPAIGCLVVGVLNKQRNAKNHIHDFAGVLIGGMAVGALGLLWLFANGALPAFYEQMTQWNPEYFAAGRERWSTMRFRGMWQRFFPWLLIHFLALPVAIHSFRKPFGRHSLISAMYIGWMLQSFMLQHLLDYIHVPAILLGIAVIAFAKTTGEFLKPAGLGFLMLALYACPLLDVQKVGCWTTCVTEGSTATVRSKLSETIFPDWTSMDAVADFLRKQEVSDGDVTCYNAFTIHFYHQMKLRPSTRFVYMSTLISLFPSRRDEIQAAVENSQHRYVITELLENGLQADQQWPPATLKQDEHRFPWSHPVVFKAGRYLVHELQSVPGKIGPLQP